MKNVSSYLDAAERAASRFEASCASVVLKWPRFNRIDDGLAILTMTLAFPSRRRAIGEVERLEIGEEPFPAASLFAEKQRWPWPFGEITAMRIDCLQTRWTVFEEHRVHSQICAGVSKSREPASE